MAGGGGKQRAALCAPSGCRRRSGCRAARGPGGPTGWGTSSRCGSCAGWACRNQRRTPGRRCISSASTRASSIIDATARPSGLSVPAAWACDEYSRCAAAWAMAARASVASCMTAAGSSRCVVLSTARGGRNGDGGGAGQCLQRERATAQATEQQAQRGKGGRVSVGAAHRGPSRLREVGIYELAQRASRSGSSVSARASVISQLLRGATPSRIRDAGHR